MTKFCFSSCCWNPIITLYCLKKFVEQHLPGMMNPALVMFDLIKLFEAQCHLLKMGFLFKKEAKNKRKQKKKKKQNKRKTKKKKRSKTRVTVGRDHFVRHVELYLLQLFLQSCEHGHRGARH